MTEAFQLLRDESLVCPLELLLCLLRILFIIAFIVIIINGQVYNNR